MSTLEEQAIKANQGVDATLVDPMVLIDWSVISHKNFHKMAGSGYEAETGNEHLEFALNLYQYMLYITTRFQPKDLYICMDSKPYWRNEPYRKWYVDNSRIFRRKNEEGKIDLEYFLVEYDQKKFQYTYSHDKEGWFQKKLVKKDYDAILWDDMIEVDESEREEVLYNELKEFAPTYKGGRGNGPWDFETPRRGYTDESGKYIPGFYDLSEGIAPKIAGTFGGKVLKAHGAEADDIIAHMVKTNTSGRSIIVVSVDSDLHQLIADNMFMHYFNPNMSQPDKDGKWAYTPWGEFWNITKKKAMYDLRFKILSGDSGDNINPCMQIDPKKGTLKASCIGKKTAEKWLAELSLKEISQLVEPKSFARNRLLVHLDNIPQWVKSNIDLAILNAKVPPKVDESEYNLPHRKRLTTINEALTDAGKGNQTVPVEPEKSESTTTETEPFYATGNPVPDQNPSGYMNGA